MTPCDSSFSERRVISLAGKAMHGWRMLEDGDNILLGLSGGKDSLSLLWLLAERRRRIPINFTVKAVHVEMGYHTVDHKALAGFCEGLGVEFHLIGSDYGPRAHSPENREKSPCFFCAFHRRRELFQSARRLGCAKIALAHQQDDILETFMMNLLYAGSMGTMLPVQPFFQGEITVIRPLALINASQTGQFCRKKGLPLQPPCCPSSARGKRFESRQWLESLYAQNRRVRSSFWHAITSSGLKSLPQPPGTQRRRRGLRGQAPSALQGPFK
jgi:tRNA 2-thiocytidine biosynthesis protein TtcA